MASISENGLISVLPYPDASVSDVLPSLIDLAADVIDSAAEAPMSDSEDVPIFEEDESPEVLLALQDEAAPSAPEGFVISLTMKGRCRRLHFAGGCFRVAGVNFKLYEDWGQECPPEARFTHRCKDCFPAGRATTQKAEVETVMSGDDGYTSSASSAAAGAAAEGDSDNDS